MTLPVVALAVPALIVLSSWGKVKAFLAFLLVALAAGLAQSGAGLAIAAGLHGAGPVVRF